MNEGTQNRAEGKAKEMGGKAEQVAGDFLNDNELKVHGVTNEAEGKTQGIVSKPEEVVGNVTGKFKDAVTSTGHKDKDTSNGRDTNNA